MSQQQHPAEPPEKEPITVSFSWPKLAGGALAAATAAAIGSTLGVAGTIVGAAVASLVGAIAGTLYSAGIDRTHRKVAAVITRSTPDGTQVIGVVPASAAEPDDTLVDLIPVAGAGAEPEIAHRARRRWWRLVAISAAAIFAVSLVLITVVELGLGRALGGGDGTTVSQVVRPQPSRTSSAKPTSTPTPSASSTTPSATPTETPAPAPSPSEPTATVEPTVPPTSAVTLTPTAVPSAAPASASVAESAATP